MRESHLDLIINPGNARAGKILIVDDDPDTCQLLQFLFQRKGYHTKAVTSGRQAIQQVQIDTPDVVVLDILMPDMDGWETYRRVRELSDSPVLFLSALTSGEYAAQALRMGADDYLRKPYSNVELLARVENALARARSNSNRR